MKVLEKRFRVAGPRSRAIESAIIALFRDAESRPDRHLRMYGVVHLVKAFAFHDSLFGLIV